MAVRAEVSQVSTAGQTTWWINAVLGHHVPLDVGIEHLSGSVSFHTDPPVPWTLAFGALRSREVTHLDLRVVEPGDPMGLPGPAAVTRVVVASGLAAVTEDGTMVLVPVGDTDRWQALESTGAPTSAMPLGTLSEARSLMRTSMAELTHSFTSLEPDDLALAELGALRSFHGPVPPPCADPRAVQLATDALRVWWLTLVAADLSERRGESSPAPVRSLRPLARRAVCVAFSEPLRS